MGADHFDDQAGGRNAGGAESSAFTPPPEWRPVAAAGWSCWHVDETGSTNTDLLAAAAAGAPDGAVVIAGYQRAGRGRLDRQWDAPRGANVLMSVLFRGRSGAGNDLVRSVAIAAVEASRALAGADVAVKWPNDLLLDGRKLGGILAQVVGDALVVGLGLNVGWAPPGAVMLGRQFEPRRVALAVLGELTIVGRLGGDELDARYRSHLATLGQRVRVELPGGDLIEGVATGVERDGRLIVLDECAISHRLDVGDIVHLRGGDLGG